jgi:hypothetical protein
MNARTAPRAAAGLTLAVLAVTLALPALAEDPKGPPPPSPEQQRLGWFVGKWKGSATVKENPFMPAGTMTTSDDCAWFEGKYAVVCRGTAKGPMGTMKSLGIMGWNGEEKTYVWYGLDSSPMAGASVARGTLEGSTWTYSDESRMGGKVVKSRYVIAEKGKDAYDFRWEIQGADGTWVTTMTGTVRRAR